MSKTLNAVLLRIPIPWVANIAMEYLYSSDSKEPFTDAFKYGYYEKCEQILSDNPGLFVESGFMYSCIHGHIEIVRLAISHIDNYLDWRLLPYRDEYGDITTRAEKKVRLAADFWNDGLRYACRGGHMDIVSLMLEQEVAKNWNCALSQAIRGGNMEVIKLILARSSPISSYVLGIELKEACKTGNTEIARLLVRSDATCLNDCLKIASEHGHIEIVRLMLEYGADDWRRAILLTNNREIRQLIKDFRTAHRLRSRTT